MRKALSLMQRSKAMTLTAFLAEHQGLDLGTFMANLEGPFLICSPGTTETWIIDLGAHDTVLERPLTIGRDPATCDVVVASPSVSRKHCVIEKTDKGWKIRDIGSRNGIFVGSKRLEANSSKILSSGSILTLGKRIRVNFLDSASLFFSIFTQQTTSAPTKKRRALAKQILDKYSDNSSEAIPLDNFLTDTSNMDFQDYLEHFTSPVLIRLQSIYFEAGSSEIPTGKLRRPSSSNIFEKAAFWVLDESKEKIALGRNQSCDILLGEMFVPREHAHITHQDSRWYIENASANETVRVGKKTIKGRQELFDEDFIRLGRESLLRFMTPTTFWNFTRLYSTATNF